MRRGRNRKHFPARVQSNANDDGDGWAQWGGYMAAKRAKLDQQFNFDKKKNASNLTSSENSAEGNVSQIFQGVSVYINGCTDPPEPELRTIFTNHGGLYTNYLSGTTTFVIASNLPMAKKKLLASKTLKAAWITDSVKAGRKLDHRKYMLYNLNEENKQGTLSQLFVRSTLPVKSNLNSNGSQSSSSTDVNQNEPNVQVEVPSISLDLTRAHTNISTTSSISDSISKNLSNISNFLAEIETTNDLAIAINNSGSENVSTAAPLGGNRLKSAGEDGFLEDFYSKSRLHLIATMKKDVQNLVAEWRRDPSHKLSLAKEYAETVPLAGDPLAFSSGQVLFHVDLDCFFVAVGLLSRPGLRNKPIVVTHSKGTGKQDSRSDISCASYEARAKGIKAGMWVHQAKNLCPDIEVIPYEFEEYRRVSRIFFETVGSLTLEMEPISIDEMIVDVTEILRETASTPDTLATFLRQAILDKAGINASIGIGFNKLAAKLAVRVAKDNHTGHHLLNDSELKEYIGVQSVKKLPSVGWATADRLATQFNVKTGKELQELSLDELKRAFGVKIGEKLHLISRGIDNDSINCDSVLAKTISAGCSWGVRFNERQELDKFIKDLASEICQRAGKSKCLGSKLSISLYIVRKGYEKSTAVKPGGHGIVDISTRTRKLLHHSREPSVISAAAIAMARSVMQTSIPASLVRGVSLAMDDLRYEHEMSDKEKKTIQTTLFSGMKKADETKRQHVKTKNKSDIESYREVASINILDKSGPVISQGDISLEDTCASVTELKQPTQNSTVHVANDKRKMIESDPVESQSKSNAFAEDNSNRNVAQVSDGSSSSAETEEMDIFTGYVLQATPVKRNEAAAQEVENGQRLLSSDSQTISSSNDSNESVKYSEPEIPHLVHNRLGTVEYMQAKESQIIPNLAVPEVIQTKILKLKPPQPLKGKQSKIIKMPENKPDQTRNNPTATKPQSTFGSNVLNEYDPAIQQRILDSFKKPIKPPCLNGLSDIAEIFKLIDDGTKGRAPTPDDVTCLESYFKDLISGPIPFLTQSCEALARLSELKSTLLGSSSDKYAKIWIPIFEGIISELQLSMKKKFGGQYRI